MHGLVFRTIEAFVTDTFGATRWASALEYADIPLASFEAMLAYDPAFLPRVLTGCAKELERAETTILEDVGTYLITHQNHASVSRLMRFGGHSFVEMVRSLDELPGRTRLAVEGLDLPEVTVREHRRHCFLVSCTGDPAYFGFVLVGLLRAMADDYGVLAVLEHLGIKDGTEIIEITVVDTAFGQDRGFDLVLETGEII